MSGGNKDWNQQGGGTYNNQGSENTENYKILLWFEHNLFNISNDQVLRASASWSIIWIPSRVKSVTFIIGIHSFPAWLPALKG